ncbi:RNA-directed DNA polymerase, eukaryota, reverse transcriptase zinc-binding domain protein [Tanacetum coccineum]|uniref:RNA-directed DNA polymerase, eukaryota, reverse transcriptase zinc-binding domain protein n=1 Tax=Tanacetum coccineum TaxID=301880 RepID=A0ABQ5DPW8_9ASTR
MLKEKKMAWFKWSRALVSKEKGGLGVASLFALNRALLFKWIWRFHNEKKTLWSRFICALYGNSGGLNKRLKVSYTSNWVSIVNEISRLKDNNIDLMKFLKKRADNGRDTRFWEDVWRGDMSFKSCFPRVYALETDKKISVANKLNHNVADSTLCRFPRNGVEMDQYRALADILEGVILPDMSDRWIWSLTGSGEFSRASSRKFIDDQSIVGANQQTRWIKVVPGKIKILAWKIRFDFLPTRLNLSRRGVEIQSIICPTCNKEVECTSHVFFSCSLVRDIYRKIAAWWELSHSDFQKFDDWFDWLLAARVSSKQRSMLEGIFYIAWWLIWNYRNKYLFYSKTPSKEIIFDVLVSKSFDSCRYRSKASFSRVEWMKNLNLITL